eukprot:195301-Rhodomonas_salina.3
MAEAKVGGSKREERPSNAGAQTDTTSHATLTHELDSLQQTPQLPTHCNTPQCPIWEIPHGPVRDSAHRPRTYCISSALLCLVAA